MLYYHGLSQMSRQEALDLTAQLKSLNGLSAMEDSLSKTALQFKKKLLGGMASVLERKGHKGYAEKVRQVEQRFNWDCERLSRRFEEETIWLSRLTDAQLLAQLRKEFEQLAEIKSDGSDQAIAEGILRRAARSLDINPLHYLDLALLEMIVFEASVDRQISELKNRLQAMGPDERAKLELLLQEELNKLCKHEREAIRRFSGLDQLSGQAMVNVLKTMSGVAVAKMVFAGSGFGAFLFLTTLLKGTSLLVGVSLSFGTYVAASSALAFLVSAPALFLLLGLSGGFVLHNTSRKIGDQLAQMVLVSGRLRLNNGMGR